MSKTKKLETPLLKPTQIAYVIKDLEKSKTFFQEMFGVKNFMPTGTTRLQDYDGTYYGKVADAENLVTMTYSGGTFIEIIQPLSGKSIFKDFIDNNPAGGVHHIAYSTKITNLDNVIADFESKGFEVVSSFDTPIAKIVFFDTREEIGVFTEIMGITEEGEKAVEEMKMSMSQD
ncbi:MAG: VOC family protein [Bacteroidetes bacterium]|jgi:methylmalonyl-CoA/ethylmalonyl-CoA epimerase|nr:VOC family protein [Bacteroidota bacterium]MBK7567543.1 VOC family protein [Bacteroidota bacterium]